MAAHNRPPSRWTVFRIVALVVAAKALYHLLTDWEWIPGPGTWGIVAILSLFFWAAVLHIADVLMRRFMKDRGLLNAIQGLVIVVISAYLLW